MWMFLFIVFELNIWWLFYLVFNYLINYVPWWYVFAPKILWIIIMIVFIIITFLSFISTIPTVYKNKEVPFLLVNPISYLDIFKYGVFKVVFYASFGSLFILFPAFIAFSVANGFWLLYYLAILFVVWSLTVLAWFLWVMVFLLFSKFILSLKIYKRNIIFLSALIWIIYVVFFLLPSIVVKDVDGEFSLFETYIFSYQYDNLLLPFNWFSKFLEYVWSWDLVWSLVYIIFIISSISLIWLALFSMWKHFYFTSIENLNNFYIVKTKKKLKFKTAFTRFKYLNLIIKDILVHIKDSVQWTQLLIFFVLLLLYIWVIKWTSIKSVQNINIASIITIWNLWVIWFFLSAIALRFVFPNLSLEWKSFWILRTIPLKLNLFYILKIVFFSIFLLFVWYILTYFYIDTVWIKPEIEKVLYILIFPIIVTIVSIFFTMWSIYPEFKETNPSKISTSFSWLLSIFIWNWLVILFLFFLYPKFQIYYENLLLCNSLWISYFYTNIISIYIFCAVFISLLVYMWFKRFKNIEL